MSLRSFACRGLASVAIVGLISACSSPATDRSPGTPTPAATRTGTPPLSPPTGVAVQVDGATATVIWHRPQLSGSSELSGYRIRLDSDDPRDVDADATFLALGTVTPGKHVVSVEAVNAAGAGPAAEYSFAVAPTSSSPTASDRPSPSPSITPRPKPSSTATRTATPKPVTTPMPVSPKPGPHLFFLGLKRDACRAFSTGDVDVAYTVRLRVYGKTATDNWLMRSRFSDGSYGSVGPDSAKAMPGGREFRFTLGESLSSRKDKLQIAAEYVIDTDAGRGRYTRLFYESGPAVLTDRYCA
jgi:hypothetical protein